VTIRAHQNIRNLPGQGADNVRDQRFAGQFDQPLVAPPGPPALASGQYGGADQFALEGIAHVGLATGMVQRFLALRINRLRFFCWRSLSSFLRPANGLVLSRNSMRTGVPCNLNRLRKKFSR